MTDFIDRAILIGLGLEKKIKELVGELQRLGEKEVKTGKEGEGLTPKKRLENMIVEESMNLVKELLSTLRSGKERLEEEVVDFSQRFVERLNLATKEDIDVIKEMARVAREKVDAIEKKIEELEHKGRKK